VTLQNQDVPPAVTSQTRLHRPERNLEGTVMPARKPNYVARFSYQVLPVHREKALELISLEAKSAREQGRAARLLIPITRAHGCAALQFELELNSLDDLEQFRRVGVEGEGRTGSWMREFDQILQSPPTVEILRIASLED
jgi:hypothetical protein